MFAVGDQVFYEGKGSLHPKEIYVIGHVVNNFVYVHGVRYQAKSFRSIHAPKPPEVVKDLMAELKERVDRTGVHVCSYALEFENGHRRYQIADVCHARLPFGGQYNKAEERGNPLKAVALNVSGHIKKCNKDTLNAYKRHVQYILTESPWKDAFIPKPLEDVYTSGVYLDITKNYSYCVAAAMALRTGSEFPSKLSVFERLMKLGFSPNVSYVVAHFTYADKFTTFTGGHHVMNNTDMTMGKLASFFNTGVIATVDKASYKDSAGKPYSIFALIESGLKLDALSIFNQIIRDCNHIVDEGKVEWGVRNQTIDVKDITKLVILANTFAKEIK